MDNTLSESKSEMSSKSKNFKSLLERQKENVTLKVDKKIQIKNKIPAYPSNGFQKKKYTLPNLDTK